MQNYDETPLRNLTSKEEALCLNAVETATMEGLFAKKKQEEINGCADSTAQPFSGGVQSEREKLLDFQRRTAEGLRRQREQGA
jgi:hypothetical protein